MLGAIGGAGSAAQCSPTMGVSEMPEGRLFTRLVEINKRPQLFVRDTVEQLWTEPHRSEQMLRHHLDGSVDVSSRTTAFIEKSVRWISDTFELGPGKSVADLGCGPGLYTNRLALTGAAVVGVDFSARSIVAQPIDPTQVIDGGDLATGPR